MAKYCVKEIDLKVMYCFQESSSSELHESCLNSTHYGCTITWKVIVMMYFPCMGWWMTFYHMICYRFVTIYLDCYVLVELTGTPSIVGHTNSHVGKEKQKWYDLEERSFVGMKGLRNDQCLWVGWLSPRK